MVERGDARIVCLGGRQGKSIGEADIERSVAGRIQRNCGGGCDQPNVEGAQRVLRRFQVLLALCRLDERLGVVDERKQQRCAVVDHRRDRARGHSVMGIATIEYGDYDIGVEHAATHGRSSERSRSR